MGSAEKAYLERLKTEMEAFSHRLINIGMELNASGDLICSRGYGSRLSLSASILLQLRNLLWNTYLLIVCIFMEIIAQST